MRFRLVPTDDRFFELFSESALNVAECARRLQDLVVDFTDTRDKLLTYAKVGLLAPSLGRELPHPKESEPNEQGE